MMNMLRGMFHHARIRQALQPQQAEGQYNAGHDMWHPEPHVYRNAAVVIGLAA